ncbi:MAG: glycosyltransferase family 39 protein [Bryobacterales bacterium]|nr:glycosyltransferase family 39 protein [Bryobacterales bacterium]
MPQAFYILLGCALTIGCSYVLGRILFSYCRVRLYREEQHLFGFLCGAALLHLVVFTMMSTHTARKGVFAGVAAAILLWGWSRGALGRPNGDSLPPLGKTWTWVLRLGVAAYALLYWSNSMAPEMSPDGSSYHLGYVARYLRDHGFTRITNDMYASLSQGTEMLYAFAFVYGRHSAAAMVHCAFTLSMPFLMLAHARRFGFAEAGAGAGLLFLCSPVVGVSGTTAYNDVATACVVFGVYSLLRIWLADRDDALLIPLGLLSGFCYAMKYTAALSIPFVAVFLFSKCLRTKTAWRRPMLIFAACAVVMILPWMAKNWIIVDNPLSPFFNKWFPNEYIHVSFEQEYVQRMKNYGEPKALSEIPLDLTLHGAMFAGMLGPVFLLTPLALLSLRFAEGRWLLLAASVFLLPYFNNIGTRFLLPSLPFFSLAMAMAIVRTRHILMLLVVLHAVLSWPHVLRKYCSPYAWRLERIPIAAALRLTPEERYLSQRFGSYSVARMVEDFVPPGGKVFTFATIAEAYTRREILTAYKSASNNILGEIIWAALFAEVSPVHRAEYRFPEAPLRRLRLYQTKTGTDQCSISELRVLRQGKELRREPDWRVRAWPKPSDAPLALDNSPVTRWRSWQSIRPGYFLEVDLGAEHPIDAIVLEQTKDQYQAAFELYGQTEKGRWTLLSAKPVESDVPPIRALRRAAMEELRARGIHYILAMPEDPGAEDYLANPRLWGVQVLAERGGARLYRIEANQQ